MPVGIWRSLSMFVKALSSKGENGAETPPRGDTYPFSPVAEFGDPLAPVGGV